MSKDKIIVAEYFYSIQGEGPTMGRPAIFLRLGGCNLFCNGAWRCDTIEVWQKGKAEDIVELAKKISADIVDYNFPTLIVTGGEPLIQQEAVYRLFNNMDVILRKRADRGDKIRPSFIEIETNGTIIPEFSNIVDQWNVSIKLEGSGEDFKKRIKEHAIRYFVNNKKSIFKFVVSSRTDIHEVGIISNVYDISNERIWLMPACNSREELIKRSPELSEICKENGYNFSPRLQLLIWDKTVGV